MKLYIPTEEKIRSIEDGDMIRYIFSQFFSEYPIDLIREFSDKIDWYNIKNRYALNEKEWKEFIKGRDLWANHK